MQQDIDVPKKRKRGPCSKERKERKKVSKLICIRPKKKKASLYVLFRVLLSKFNLQSFWCFLGYIFN